MSVLLGVWVVFRVPGIHPYCHDILHLKIYFFVLSQVSPAGIKELSLVFLDGVQASGVMRGR